MGYKKLISPEFRVTVGDYEVTDGIEVECFSSKESHMDWCRVELSPQLQGVLKFKDMDEARRRLATHLLLMPALMRLSGEHPQSIASR